MIDKTRLAFVAGLLGATALGGCTVGPDYKRPAWASPGSWFAGPKEAVKPPPSIPVAEPIDVDWWRLFNDPVLTGLERRVAAENLDVRAASVRFAESRAELGIAKASQFPTLNGNGSYTREKASDEGIFGLIPGSTSGTAANGAFGNSAAGAVSGANIPPFDLYQGGFDASWEVDLWGGVRRSVEVVVGLVRGIEGGAARHPAVQPGRGRARLHPVARRPGGA